MGLLSSTLDQESPGSSPGGAPGSSHPDVRLGKIVADEQERLVERGGERIRKTVTEVEARGVTVFAVLTESASSELRLLRADRYDVDGRALDEQIDLALAVLSVSIEHDDPSFDESSGGDAVDWVGLEGGGNTRRLWFIH